MAKSTKLPRLVKHKHQAVAEGGLMLFDTHPIPLKDDGVGFLLTARGVTPFGDPSIGQWTEALRFAGAAEESSPYWIGDLLRYADNRSEWREMIDQAIASTGLSAGTLHNLGWVARRVEPPEREIAQTVSHATKVAPLERPEQTKWLTKSREENWSARELERNIKHSKRERVLEMGSCERCNSQDPQRIVQTWHLSVGDCHERPILCDNCAASVALTVRAALQPITKV